MSETILSLRLGGHTSRARSSGRSDGIKVIDEPVQLIVNTKDKYVRPYGYDDTARWVPRLRRRHIEAGHFSPMSHPGVMAAAVHDFADLAH